MGRSSTKRRTDSRAFYNIALTQGVALTLDAQVIDPVIDGVDTATILGARLNIRF